MYIIIYYCLVCLDYDGAEPSPNSVALGNLYRLARLKGAAEYEYKSKALMAHFGQHLSRQPASLTTMLTNWLIYEHFGPIVVTISRGLFPLSEMKDELNNPLVLLVESDEHSSGLAHVCHDQRCLEPVKDAAALKGQIAEILKDLKERS